MTIKELINKIDQLKSELDKLKPLKQEDDDRLWKKFRLEWNYNSNHMEGNTLTYGDTALLLIFDKISGDYTGREVEEMKSHDLAIKMVVEFAKEKERDLNETFIRQLNEIILVRPFWKEAITPDGQPTRREITPGEYKKYPNSVRLENGEIFHYASPEATPSQMNDLMNFYKVNSVSTEIHPLWLAAMMHYKFVCIHPFDDGNGRVARLLMNYVLLKNNFPPVILKSNDKKAYLNALNQADIGNDESFQFYIGEQLAWSLQLSINAAQGKSIDEVGDLDKEISLLKKEQKNETVLTHNGSSENICLAMGENIIPLFKVLEEKCNNLKDLFFDYDRKINFELEEQSTQFSLGSKESEWETLIKNWLHNDIRMNGKKIRLFKYSYELKGLKKTVSANTFWIGIEIRFNEYNYTIQTDKNRNTPVQLPYAKKLKDEDILNLITPELKEIIERIKQAK